MISVWVLSESFILNSDMKYLENNNKDLSIKYNLLLSDYNKVLIDRYNQINLICETLAKNNILIAELNNDINYLNYNLTENYLQSFYIPYFPFVQKLNLSLESDLKALLFSSYF